MDIVREPVGPGQESVWDYPRPPRIEPTSAHLRIELGGETVAETPRASGCWRPATRRPTTSRGPPSPTVRWCPSEGSTYCEWKGRATYFDVHGGDKVAPRAAWTYPDAEEAAAACCVGYVAVMPAAMDGCFVDGERARPQQGGFYGGWITSAVVGPFKGGPGTDRLVRSG